MQWEGALCGYDVRWLVVRHVMRCDVVVWCPELGDDAQ